MFGEQLFDEQISNLQMFGAMRCEFQLRNVLHGQIVNFEFDRQRESDNWLKNLQQP